MITSLREAKARLSELIALAEKGEDVTITVRGKVKARLTRASQASAPQMAQWRNELERVQLRYSIKSKAPSEKIVADLREERC